MFLFLFCVKKFCFSYNILWRLEHAFKHIIRRQTYMYNNFNSGGYCGNGCDHGPSCGCDHAPSCGCDCGPSYGSPLVETLCNNIGRVVTIFTSSGGVSGSGFTGLLVWANKNSVKIITNLPSAPPNPLGECGCNNGLFWNSNYCNGSMYGSAAIIPTCQIVSFVFTEV